MAAVLVADDDRALVGVLTLLLGQAGYEVMTAYDGESAVRRTRDERPDLVILDMHMPRLRGDEAVKRIREELTTPVIMLTGSRDSDEQARLLDLGADDYITKPVGKNELLARVRAVLRGAIRGAHVPTRRVELEGLEVDTAAHSARVGGRDLPITRLELRLLGCLAKEVGTVARIGDLLRAGWPELPDPDPSWLRGPLHRLRVKLDDAKSPYAIENVRGVGYRLAAPSPARALATRPGGS